MVAYLARQAQAPGRLEWCVPGWARNGTFIPNSFAHPLPGLWVGQLRRFWASRKQDRELCFGPAWPVRSAANTRIPLPFFFFFFPWKKKPGGTGSSSSFSGRAHPGAAQRLGAVQTHTFRQTAPNRLGVLKLLVSRATVRKRSAGMAESKPAFSLARAHASLVSGGPDRGRSRDPADQHFGHVATVRIHCLAGRMSAHINLPEATHLDPSGRRPLGRGLTVAKASASDESTNECYKIPQGYYPSTSLSPSAYRLALMSPAHEQGLHPSATASPRNQSEPAPKQVPRAVNKAAAPRRQGQPVGGRKRTGHKQSAATQPARQVSGCQISRLVAPPARPKLPTAPKAQPPEGLGPAQREQRVAGPRANVQVSAVISTYCSPHLHHILQRANTPPTRAHQARWPLKLPLKLPQGLCLMPAAWKWKTPPPFAHLEVRTTLAPPELGQTSGRGISRGICQNPQTGSELGENRAPTLVWPAFSVRPRAIPMTKPHCRSPLRTDKSR